jgi:hypothetical protein
VKAVSNASPLIILGKLGQLGLLLKVFDQVAIPREVYSEVVINGLHLGSPDAMAVDFLVQQGRIQVVGIALPSPLPGWAAAIDAGELEAILLAQDQQPDWVIIDNAHARRAARQAGLAIKGTVGVLLEAFRRDYLAFQDLELLLQTIKSRPEFWISESLCDQALAQARREM